MKPVQRHADLFSSIFALIRSAYYLIILPCALIIASITLIIGLGSSFRYTLYPSDYFLLFLLWATILVPLLYRRLNISYRRNRLAKIVTLLSSTERFTPQREIFNASHGKYLGLDTRTGNILYIHLVKTGVVDVIGLTMNDWTNRELEGSVLRLFTRNPDLPVLSIIAPPVKATELFETLGAMSHNSYVESFPQEPWPLHVSIQSRFVEFEHDVVVPQASN